MRSIAFWCAFVALMCGMVSSLTAADPDFGLLAKHELLQFRIADGRLTVPRFATAQSRTMTGGDETPERSESLRIDTEGDDAGFEYKRTFDQETAFVAYAPQRSLVWKHRTRESNFEYEQTAQTCGITIESSEKTWQWKERDLWRILLVADPQERKLIARELNALLSASTVLAEVSEIEKIIAQASSFDAHDAELRSVVRKTTFTPDYPQTTAERLRRDPSFWFTLLDHRTLAVRTLAHKNLERYFSRPIPFDPAAEPSVRTEQRGKIGAAFFPQTAEETSRHEKRR